jgi:hypothetical protein
MFTWFGGGLNLNETTTIKISKKTAEALERLREKLNAESIDEVLQFLFESQRRAILENGFSVDRGRIKPFSKGARGEDRD